MTRVIPLILALLLFCVPAAATETGSNETPVEEVIQDVESELVTESHSEEETPASDPETLTSETEVEGSNITVNVTLPAQEPAAVSEPESIEEDYSEPEPIPVTYSVTTLDLMEEDETAVQTLTDTVETLFGPYTPRTQTVTEYLSDGSVVSSQEIVPGLAGLDYPWLASVTFFGLVMFCFFKMLGGLLK